MPEVSVIIPTHNRWQLLMKAVGSVLSQTMTDFELIISDDGSTDDTQIVAQDLAIQDSRIQYIRNDENRGVAWAIRDGVEVSHCERFSLLSDDDEYRPTYLDVLYKALDDNPDYDMVYGGTYIEYWDSIFGGREGENVIMSLPYPHELPSRNVVWGFMAKRAMYDTLGGWPTQLRIANDWHFFLMAYASGMKFLRIEDPLYVYRYWTGGHTFTCRELQLNESDEVLRMYREGLLDVRQKS